MTSYVQAFEIGGAPPRQPHAASASQFFTAIRNAQHSNDIAAAYQPDSLCGVQVILDHLSHPKAWHPGVPGACMACVAALP